VRRNIAGLARLPTALIVLLAACTQLATRDSPTLDGTSWQLVRFQGGDATVLLPDERSKYTLVFGADGVLRARIDCNRASGSWKSSGPQQLEFGPMAITRAQCPPGSLHDQVVKQLPYVRSYLVKGGHLYLSLMADGGTYEFEPSN